MFENDLEIAKIFSYKIADFGDSGVNDERSLDNPNIFCVIVIDLG
jgi:hypothetical protein